MKKVLVLSLSAAVVLSSCSTYAGSGAITGGSLGSILGSAIGGIAGGARGSDIGSIVGMAGGAIIGASTGAKADRRAKEDVHDHYEKVQQRKAREKRNRTEYDYYNQTDDYGRSGSVDGSGFDNTNSGDDRIYDSKAVIILVVTALHSQTQRLQLSQVLINWLVITNILQASRLLMLVLLMATKMACYHVMR